MKRVVMTATKSFEIDCFHKAWSYFEPHNDLEWTYTAKELTRENLHIAENHDAVCIFVTERMMAHELQKLKAMGIQALFLRSAGYNHVDIEAARNLQLRVARVPKYSPEAIAEFAVGLYLTWNRKIHKAYHRVREGNYSLDGLVGDNVSRKCIGIIGTGLIGRRTAQIFSGFGSRILMNDPTPDLEWAKKYNLEYCTFDYLVENSDVVSLHVPLLPNTHHMINNQTLSQMKPGTVLINTSRGALVDTRALIQHLKSGHLAGACLDVYEEEEGIFFHDLQEDILQDDSLARLITLPNVLLTAHQAFLTTEALEKIAKTTLYNAICWSQNTINTDCSTHFLV